MTLIVQTVIKQWDKGQNSPEEVQHRDNIARQYKLNESDSFTIFDQRAVLNKVGDDRLGDRIKYHSLNDKQIQIDKFYFSFEDKVIRYQKDTSDSGLTCLGSIENQFMQADYQWRYRVFEGGYYYWLYEHIIFNFIHVDTVDDEVFLSHKPLKFEL